MPLATPIDRQATAAAQKLLVLQLTPLMPPAVGACAQRTAGPCHNLGQPPPPPRPPGKCHASSARRRHRDCCSVRGASAVRCVQCSVQRSIVWCAAKHTVLSTVQHAERSAVPCLMWSCNWSRSGSCLLFINCRWASSCVEPEVAPMLLLQSASASASCLDGIWTSVEPCRGMLTSCTSVPRALPTPKRMLQRGQDTTRSVLMACCCFFSSKNVQAWKLGIG
jgi:hypothetical protein